jgi:hypothetical protein
MSSPNQPDEVDGVVNELPEEDSASVDAKGDGNTIPDSESSGDLKASTSENEPMSLFGSSIEQKSADIGDMEEREIRDNMANPHELQASTGANRPETAQVSTAVATATSTTSTSEDSSLEKEEMSNHDPLESSTATLKAATPPPKTIPKSLHLSLNDELYRDPTPKTPQPSQPPSRSTSNATQQLKVQTEAPERSPTRSDAGFDEKHSASEDEREGTSRTEIQTIMDQFGEGGQGPGHEEIMSPRLELASPLLGTPMQHPPRKSSLEPVMGANITNTLQDLRLSSNSSPKPQAWDQSDIGPTVPPKPASIRSFNATRGQDDRHPSSDSVMSPQLHRPPPPEPEPEPDLPVDFHRFLEQLRHKTADPVAKFLRSFLQEFGKKQWMVHEQVKIISDFLAFITNKMGQCEVWREVSDAEFDNAREGMEKLVMNRLYTQTFSPAIPPPQPIPGAKPKRRGAERPMGPGRRGQHQEDVERDDILAQKVSIYGWIKEEHLEIPPVGDSGKRFLVLAQQGTFPSANPICTKLMIAPELLKIKTYRAPRDKIICVLNCCKVIFGKD